MTGWMSALRFVGIGAYIGLSIVLGVWIGSLLDRHYDSQPLLTLIGLALGLLLAATGVYRMLKGFIKQWQDNDKRD
jgi:F0F1-type ATP synthase assembly protein I